MTAILLRLIVYAAVAAFVWFGVRRLWRDLTAPFRGNAPVPPAAGTPHPGVRSGDRTTGDVIELKRDADGVYRPLGGDGR